MLELIDEIGRWIPWFDFEGTEDDPIDLDQDDLQGGTMGVMFPGDPPSSL